MTTDSWMTPAGPVVRFVHGQPVNVAHKRLLLSVISLLVWACFGAPARSADLIQFNRDVRPILSDKCFACHGPDADSREADLRLDQREELLADRGGYRIVQAGKPGESELIARIATDDDDMRMPPADSGEPLTDQARRILSQWIAQGATWQDHWSLTPLVRPTEPDIDDPWPRNSIDRFVFRRLQREKLQPAPPADRRTLIRRLYFDVIGLPPTAKQVQAFCSDSSPDAYETLVDSLLASQHYGERMAMYWLDLVRYADTLGYHGDQVRSVSPYRDYVIRAFNENKSFDQFTIENLAGDLLPNATLDSRVASTYNRLNRASAEGGVQPKEYLAKYAADRVRTTGSVWLGSTIGCAECHDHKFDPFTAKDFYRFAAFFADIQEQGIVPGAKHINLLPVPTPEQQQELQQLDVAIAKAQSEWERRTGERFEQFNRWQQRLLEQAGPWVPLVPNSAISAKGATLEIQPSGAVLAKGTRPAEDVYTIELSAPITECAGIRLDVLADPSLPAQGPGRAGNGNFVVQRLVAHVDGSVVKWKTATATHSQTDYSIEHLAQENVKGWAILPAIGTSTQSVFIAEQPIRSTSDNDGAPQIKLRLEITQNHGDYHTLGHFRFYAVRGSEPQTVDDIVPESIIAILNTPSTTRTAAQVDQLWKRFREHARALAPQRSTLSDLRSAKEAINKAVITTLATSVGTPRVTRVLRRGNWMDDTGEIVKPGVPHFLDQPHVIDRDLNRLDLAQWLIAPENPLTARTMVNRLWMLFFGQGISPSVDDLGSQGHWPTHPELLDWLAIEFRESGWDIKHLVRLMVVSSTYRQSSRPRADLAARDPYNALLARQASWRIDAEMVRDNALAVSGLLCERIGGPSVRPYQPAGYWDQLNFPKRTYQHDTGDNQYRRGVYTHWQRTFLHPSLLAFDAPVREECTARRDRSNTPVQALVLMNDPTYVEAARVLAQQTVQCGATDRAGRLAWIFRQTLQRAPTLPERKILLAFFEDNAAVYRETPTDAARLLQAGLAPAVDGLDEVETAAWACVARVVLNLHETITRF